MKTTIENHDGRLRLRWRYHGKRYTLACGVADSAIGRGLARQKASQIEVDVATGHFDHTLLKYKPRILGKTPTELSAPVLFERYTQAMAKEKGLSLGLW
ncbi:DUF3596 domain-containing protein [Synechococcales cyanobacterium C]|uniref:DUF3596 domain-containing protein n=1 Tax=Petrachloros mirabilis ULC683 TaxID=2781853 RepID=A0A8K1ZWE2_9CYAN|nr:DUF3596 domain-containing protein [Petrachloros mirabilis]NCJ05337.1 DUF3596 domain-containing protein [Petrachloros mirabilis ULC683]